MDLTRSPVRVAVIGAGKVGTQIACLLSRSGDVITSVFDINAEEAARFAQETGASISKIAGEVFASADVILITTPDDAIEDACSQAVTGLDLNGKKVIHMSGAKGLSPLRCAEEAGADILSIHPIQTFPSFKAARDSLYGSTFGVTCKEELKDWATKFVSKLGGSVIFVRDEDRVLYHAASVIACNLFVMLESASIEVLKSIGIGEGEALRALIPLLRSTLENIAKLGPSRALTGPLSRGDVGTIREHVHELRKLDERIASLYRALSLWGLHLIEDAGNLSKDKIEEIRRVLEEG